MSRPTDKNKARRKARKARKTLKVNRYRIDGKPDDAGDLSPREYYIQQMTDSGIKLCDLTGPKLTDAQVEAARSYVNGDGSTVMIGEDDYWKLHKLKAQGIDVMGAVTDVHDLSEAY
jgi:hypothetical protein